MLVTCNDALTLVHVVRRHDGSEAQSEPLSESAGGVLVLVRLEMDGRGVESGIHGRQCDRVPEATRTGAVGREVQLDVLQKRNRQ